MKNLAEKILNNKGFEYLILGLILLNLGAFILQSDVNINRRFNSLFVKLEIISVIIFSIEYVIRLISLKRFKDAFRPMILIDLMAILPFYISFLTVNTIILRSLRLIRLVRLAKITRYTSAFENIKEAFVRRKNELEITGLIFISAVVTSSIFIYLAENNQGRECFNSVISSFWWAVVTFTTVGYGDAVPITACGKIIAGITAIFGVGMHGLVIGVISSALIEVIEETKKPKNSPAKEAALNASAPKF